MKTEVICDFEHDPARLSPEALGEMIERAISHAIDDLGGAEAVKVWGMRPAAPPRRQAEPPTMDLQEAARKLVGRVPDTAMYVMTPAGNRYRVFVSPTGAILGRACPTSEQPPAPVAVLLTAREAAQIAKQRELPRPADLRGWEEMTTIVKLPHDIAAAVGCGRSSLLRAIPDRATKPAEFRQLLDLIGVLMDTNAALQQHSRDLAVRLDQLSDNLEGVVRGVARAVDFANFRAETPEDEED